MDRDGTRNKTRQPLWRPLRVIWRPHVLARQVVLHPCRTACWNLGLKELSGLVERLAPCAAPRHLNGNESCVLGPKTSFLSLAHGSQWKDLWLLKPQVSSKKTLRRAWTWPDALKSLRVLWSRPKPSTLRFCLAAKLDLLCYSHFQGACLITHATGA